MKKTLQHFFKSYWPIFLLILFTCVFFWKIFILNQVAVPADILVHGSYPVKNPITTDSVSFSYPMKYVVIKDFKSGILPLWNPYILFGTPLLANFQSAAFSVTNIFYFLTDFNSAWNFQIIFQHIFACIFMYFLLRHWKISKVGAILGSISFAFGGFNLIWSEWNSHTLTASFIPLLVLFADRFIEKGEAYDGIFLSIILALQIFSGYPQIVVYTIPAIFLLWLVNFKSLNKGILLLIFIVFGIALASLQVLPSVELLKLSQRSTEVIPKEWAFLTPRQIITFIAPDFFGNHATYNYWGDKNYTSNIGFVGVVSFTLAILAIKYFKKRREILYLVVLILVSLLFSFQTPISVFLWDKDILGLKAGASYRILVIFSFAISALAGFGYDYLKNIKSNKLPLIFTGLIISLFWIYAFQLHNSVAIRNLILPTGIFIFTVILFWKTKLKFLLLFLILVELFYFGWKFTPFVSRDIVFPGNKIVSYLKNIKEDFRVVGGNEIPVDTNMVYGLEFGSGYDAEYPSTTAKYLGVLNSNDASATPENKNYLPRDFFVDNWQSEKDSTKILSTLLDPSFPIKKKIVLEDEVLKRDGEKMYFVSDAYYPGWKAFVDGKETKIYKADFAFRAIKIPKGEHEIKMVYEPQSFYLGLKISLATLIILGIIGLWRKRLY